MTETETETTVVTETRIPENTTVEVLFPMILTGAITVHHTMITAEVMNANGREEMYPTIQTKKARVG